MSSKIGLILGREYGERVRKKSFIITTLLMPVLMVAMMAIPGIIIAMGGSSDTKHVQVVDPTGVIAGQLKSSDVAIYTPTDLKPDSALKSCDAVLVIPEDILIRDSQLLLLTNGASAMVLEERTRNLVNDIVENERLKARNMGDLRTVLDEIRANSPIVARRGDKPEDSAQSSMIAYGLGVVLTFMLYMCLLLYGQMVMTSIIEEKTNRVLELVVGSASPTQLMMGKICGIGLVAVTQILLWGILITSISAFVMPAILPADVAAEAAALQNGTLDVTTSTFDLDLLQVIALFGNVGYLITMFGLLLLFLIGGFLLYAAIFAAIGSAVDNIQDASQLQSVVIFPIIFGIMFGMVAAADPTSTLSFWSSLFPFTAPMVMMARIPYGIPGWEIALSLVLLYASFIGMVWVAAKIYRVGIFMYGKKPTVKDLIRWTRYK